ncbi:2-succinyl-5-enolpyruvyl-6-hydroxy-3-cyclohexene-1-carboxylic-acid synthase [Mongoliitalea daihaiensis]|uniref:2-succinyl-5-enolpyruvyl-6-hydroxy-3- cyclohexene-1-carboxylic-acid synthase n=1 Tax=Mongoliitalea daihaiensis TaxID=2782006 RepID=UPI001F43EEB4|nr:2-succinyl-5-enolpyruvyl-6-hydroxy-3-cyclohexene-1-carboxylic-acid synthase [Mongoliitalea daihaiensis]UJP63237.1 2-succinyl-5-enolpyruvyl-6-hydroxy-3-cyclohexene-1-carboxylic-acid synthase [Mongoliitalea daihaiensis]
MILQPILDLVSICVAQGIKDAVLSPGSRCAPLTLAFSRHPAIMVKTISDERAAAFIAMGIAQQKEVPTVLVCTSGSAAYNYAPAISEAFFQQIPLLVLTADRPPEWIDQWDGQTIRQQGIFGKHIKASFQFPDAFEHEDKIWHAQRMVREAIQTAGEHPMGPVHINIPLREPFYPSPTERFEFKAAANFELLEAKRQLNENQQERLLTELERFNRIVLVCGQQRPNPFVRQALDSIVQHKTAVLITDTISNCQVDGSICFHDHFTGMEELKESLKPDLIISFGKSIISKNLKLFLRQSDAQHWHVSPDDYVPDTFKKLSKIIRTEIINFLQVLARGKETQASYYTTWHTVEQSLAKNLPDFVDEATFGEYKAFNRILKEIPTDSIIHVANSMAVRYLNFLGPRRQEIVANRGTSGIDGSNSTSVGCCFTTDAFVTLLTGDMAFFYDRNAFWHNYPISNLRIIVFNNHAGGIFRLIEGPANQPELEEFFETKQALDAKNLCQDFNIEYLAVLDEYSLNDSLQDFYSISKRPKLIEVFSESKQNAQVLKEIKKKVKRLIQIG